MFCARRAMNRAGRMSAANIIVTATSAAHGTPARRRIEDDRGRGRRAGDRGRCVHRGGVVTQQGEWRDEQVEEPLVVRAPLAQDGERQPVDVHSTARAAGSAPPRE